MLSEVWGTHQEHRERIRRELRKFLSAQEAEETANHVCKLAFGIDEEIARILKDPLARRRFDYDGQFFSPRGTRGFHTAFDGLHLLNWLNNAVLTTFFRGKEKYSAIQWLLEELGKHAWVVKRRRMNWEESHTLDLVPGDVLETSIRGTWRRQIEAYERPSELSWEERAFFQSFEEQMAERLG